ncbi:MAG: transporter permease [Acidimicrobiales bacterium]|jgi:putative ABC transport system permease protein|nr:transporter permease [Acidimicrobiales bacterium]
MWVLRVLNLRNVRRQPMRSVLAILAVGAGVTLASAVVVERQSIDHSLSRLGRQLAGPTPLRVEGATNHGGLDPAVVDRVRAVAGVESTIPVVQTVTVAGGDRAREVNVVTIGVDCSVERIVGNVGCTSEAVNSAHDSDPPFVAPALLRRLGPNAKIRTDVGAISLATAIAVPQLDGANDGRLVIFPLPQAQRLFARSGRIDAIYVVPTKGTPVAALKLRIAGAIGPWNTVLGATQPVPEARVGDLLAGFFAMFGIIGLGVGAVLIGSAVALSLEERRRELAVTSALGATPAMVIGGALLEAGILGVAGGVLGALGGIALAHPLVGGVSRITQRATGIVIGVHAGGFVVALSIALGLGTAVVAALGPARRAARIDVAAELHQRSAVTDGRPARHVGRALVYTAIAVAGLAATWLAQRNGALERWQPPTATVGITAVTLFAFIAAGAWAAVLLHAAQPLAARRTGAIGVVIGNLARDPRRVAIMTGAVAVAVGVGFGLAASVPAIHDGISQSLGEMANGRVFVSTLSVNNSVGIDAKVPPSLEAAIARVPGVSGIDHDTFVMIGSTRRRRVPVVSYENAALAFPVFLGGPPGAVIDRGEAMVGAGLARERHLRVGSILRLETPNGFVSLRVGGVWQDPDNFGRGVVVAPDVLARAWGPQPPTQLWARPAPGVTAIELARRIRAAALDPHLRVYDQSEYVTILSHEIDTFIAPFRSLQKALLAVAFLATASTLLLVGVQRRREQGVLAAIGMGPRELARMTLAEGATVGVLGSLLGAVAGTMMTVAIEESGGILFGLQPPFRLALAACAEYGAIAVVLVIAAAAWPAWRTARLEVVDAIRYE